jgi:hypothetical protein
VRFGGLSRLALRRVRTDPVVAVLAWLLLVVAAALPAAGLLYGDRVALGSLRAEFAGSEPRDRVVRVALAAPLDEIDRFDPAIRAAVGESLAAARPDPGSPADEAAPTGVELALRSGGLRLDPVAGSGVPSPGPDDRVVAASFDGLADHATLVEGRWSEAGRTPLEATLSEGAAASLGLSVGDEATVRAPDDASRAVTLRVTGTWRPDRSDPYWVADPLDLTGSETVRLTTRGPFVVARADLRRAVPVDDVGAEWRGLPAPDNLTLDAAASLRAGLALLPGRVQAIVGPSWGVAVTTGVPARLAAIEQAVVVGRQLIVLLVVQLAVVAAYALLLVGIVLAGRRRQENALLRERGASGRDLALPALVEGLVLAVPAALVATLIASMATGLLVQASVPAAVGVSSAPDASTILAAFVAAGLGAVALAAPALTMGSNLPAMRAALGRRIGQTFVQRLGLDVVLVTLAVVAIWQLRSYGAAADGGTGSNGVGRALDLVLVLTPAIGLLAGAVVAVRLMPRLAEGLELTLEGLRGLVVPLGGREVARRPGRHTRIALLVVLATALGGLATAHGGTWLQSQVDQAAYRTVGDVRVITGTSAGLAPWLTVRPARCRGSYRPRRSWIAPSTAAPPRADKCSRWT